MSSCALETPTVASTLARLHLQARGDWRQRVLVSPRWILSRLTGRDFMKHTARALRDTYSSVTSAEGRFLYLLARGCGAKNIVEFGCSYGISTTYLAAAALENRGNVVTTEIEPTKIVGARENLRSAGLAKVVTFLEGDALQTLKGKEGPIDLLFLDGMKPLYLPVLHLVHRRLRAGSLILADNVDMPSARPYAEFVRSSREGFVSSSLFGGRLELSLLVRAGT